MTVSFIISTEKRGDSVVRNVRTWFTSCLLVFLACADNRQQIANDNLKREAAVQSDGALTLTRFDQTNGYELERNGMRLHAVEWTGELLADRDIWKAGNGVTGYWSDFRVLPAQPVGLDGIAVGGAKNVRRGSTVQLAGESLLQKADRGWRVIATSVKTAQVMPPLIPGAQLVGEWSGHGAYTGHRLVIRPDFSCDYFMASKTYRGTADPNGRLGANDLANSLDSYQLAKMTTPSQPLTVYENTLVLNFIVDGKSDDGTFLLCKLGDTLQVWGGSHAYFAKKPNSR